MENINSSNPVGNATAQAADASLNNGSSNTLTTCAACGGESSVDSRFCRHCGAALRLSDAPNTAAVVAAAPIVPQNGTVEPGDTGSEAAPEAHGVSYEIDQRRARQLLDRAFMLAERGDMAAAILACRQSVALAPDAAPGFSMLGLLLERSGDVEHAAAAYQKVLKLAPDSRLEYESLQRLQAVLRQNKGGGFHFDDKELFDDGTTAGQSVPTALVPSVSQTPGAVSPATLNSANVVNGAAVTASTSAVTQFPAAVSYRDSTTSATAFNPAATNPVPLTALDFGVAPDAPASPWQRLMRQPSFFFRGFPLVATTALGLMFMLWSRQSIVSQQPQAQSAQSGGAVPASLPSDISNNDAAGSGTTQPAVNAPAANNGTGNSASSNGTSGSNAGQAFPVVNRPAGNAANGAGTSIAAPPVARRSVERSAPGAGSRPAPQFPSSSRVSAPPREAVNLPPAQLILPPPQVNQSQPVRPPIQALPQDNGDSGASSSGGSPLNPAGASGRGYIRITPARPSTSTAPVRPANRAVEAERATSSDIRSGRSERAIENITKAIDTGGDAGKDTGWRYQQRALLFLERGDNQRAADDFQTAISSYRDQIRRGERVSESRAGIQACQSGLRLALSNLRR